MSRWPILAVVTFAHALGALSVLAVAPLAPFLLDALELSRVQVGLLLPAVYLGGVLMSLPAGWLTDRVGVRLTLGGGLVIIGALLLVATLARALPPLLGTLVLAGFGFSVLNPSTGKAVVQWFPPRGRGLAMGIKQTGLTLGGLAGALSLPPIAAAAGWRAALGVAAILALVAAAIVLLVYREPASAPREAQASQPRVAELGVFLRRPGLIVVLVSGLALSTAQSSVLAYLALYVKETFALSAIAAGQVLALAQVGGTASRLAWGAVSDRFFGSRRRPGVVLNALLGAATYALLAAGAALPRSAIGPLAVLAGAGAFGWVGLYFALVAEIGGARYAGLLTGVAVAFAWSGVLVGPPVFGVLLQATGSYTAPWLTLSVVALGVAATLPWLRPLVQREPA